MKKTTTPILQTLFAASTSAPGTEGTVISAISLDTDGCFVLEATTDDPAIIRDESDRAFNDLAYAEYRPAALYAVCGKKSKGGLDRAIKRWLALGCLEKSGRGKYTKIKAVPNSPQ